MRQLTDNCNSGNCWVSRNCFLYSCVDRIIQDSLAPRLAAGNLTILYNSLITSVQKRGTRISEVQVLSRRRLQEDCRSAD